MYFKQQVKTTTVMWNNYLVGLLTHLLIIIKKIVEMIMLLNSGCSPDSDSTDE